MALQSCYECGGKVSTLAKSCPHCGAPVAGIKKEPSNFASRLEIHFHQQDEASVYLETNTTGENEKFAEVLTFCSLAMRQMVNLASAAGFSASIAHLLTEVPGNLFLMAHAELPDLVRIVDYRGSQGRKRFILNVKYAEDSFQFTMSPKGFGLLARGVGYYAPQSVLLFLRYLARKRITDEDYISALEQAASCCGSIFFSGRLSFQSQFLSALLCAREAFAANPPIEGAFAAENETELGKNLEKLVTAADKYLEKLVTAAKGGDAKAQTSLGAMYYRGDGVPQDKRKALEWHKKAAEQGLAWAQVQLGNMYFDGEGADQDYAEAAKWLRRAAEQGHTEAQLLLGDMYRLGHGVDPDLDQAKKWYVLAVGRGSEKAKERLLKLPRK